MFWQTTYFPTFVQTIFKQNADSKVILLIVYNTIYLFHFHLWGELNKLIAFIQTPICMFVYLYVC